MFALWRGLKTDPHLVNSPLIGKEVPQFHLTQLTNSQKTVTRQIFYGHISLLNVFATWCYVCRTEHPMLMKMTNVYHVRIIGLDYKDSRAKALAWLKSKGDPYQDAIYDPYAKLGINLGVYGTPETFIIDKKGIIRYKYVGAISPRSWKYRIKPVLHKRRRPK